MGLSSEVGNSVEPECQSMKVIQVGMRRWVASSVVDEVKYNWMEGSEGTFQFSALKKILGISMDFQV